MGSQTEPLSASSFSVSHVQTESSTPRSGDFLSGLSFSSAWSHSNLFGEGKRLRLEGEKGAGIFKVELDYLDPWLDGDNKRTGRRIQIRVRNWFEKQLRE